MLKQADLRIGTLAVAALALFACADLALRIFVPESAISFRAWEPMTLYASAEGAFRPGATAYRERSYGDLSHLANLRWARQYRSERFTTDAHGFRSARPGSEFPVDSVIVGDSFVVGSGVSDDETLAEQLRRKTGLRVYNGGTSQILTPADVLSLVARLEMKRGVVLAGYTSRVSLDEYVDAASAGPRLKPSHNDVFLDWRMNSRMVLLSRKAYTSLQNDRILPNAARQNARIHRLRNGARMLFLPLEEDLFYADRPLEIAYWTQLRDGLRSRGLQLTVLLIPDKFTVYQPLLTDVPPALRNKAEYLDALEKVLRSADVPVINLLAALRTEAEARLSHGEYLYWLDDTHWNAAGVAEVVNEIVASCPELRATCRGPKSPSGWPALRSDRRTR